MKKMRRYDYDFSAYSLSELDELIDNHSFTEYEKLQAIAEERCERLNSTFVMDEAFLQQFIIINNRLTELSSELYDKMVAVRASLNSLVKDEKSPIIDFHIEGSIRYENSETENIEIMERLIDPNNSVAWHIYMDSKNEYRSKEDFLMSELNWNIELFNVPMIKESNIWVCYMMHSLFCHEHISLVDLMQMKPECFYLSVESSFEV